MLNFFRAALVGKVKRMILIRSWLVIIVLGLLVSCGGGEQSVDESTFNVVITTNEGGAAGPNAAKVPSGESLQVVLQPDDNFAVSEVLGCGGTLSGTDNTLYFIPSVLADCEVIVRFEELPGPSDVEGSPILVTALSSSSTLVVVQFSEPMDPSFLETPTNFSITLNASGNKLPIISAAFVDDKQQAVALLTQAQTNSRYTVTVVNAYDLAGNAISSPISEVEVSLNSAEFTGTRPTGTEVVDSDGDGLADHIELAGWEVKVTRTDGSLETIFVSSSPLLIDTDNDGVPDAEERHGGLDPSNADTDGDTLTDDDEWNRVYSDGTKQDTDGDGIQDGFEYLFFQTSPILADTDGDKIDDPIELAAGNRNPLIADLPSPNISIGNVNLQLDTRFTFTNEAGESDSRSKTVETTLTQAEDDTFSSSNEASTTNTLNFSQELSTTVEKEVEAGVPPSGKVSASITATAKSEQGSENGSTNSFGEESSRSSEEAYHDSLSVDVARDTRESISREVLGASMKVDLKVANAGDIPFTVSNLELTAQVQDPRDRRRLIPVASLTPENNSLGSINIGVLGDTDRGPFVFNSDSVFPQEIQELMKNPRGVIIQLANYDIVDEDGNNFAFSSQTVLDRTAGITFDLGDGRVESYRVATASEHDANTGQPLGISMARALEIIGLKRYASIQDGGNGISESFAGGDDVQVVSPSQAMPNTGVEPKSIVVSAGPDGVIDAATIVQGDDVLVESDYATQLFQASESIIDGGNGIIETPLDGTSGDYYVAGDNAMVGDLVNPGAIIIRAGADSLVQSLPQGDDIKVPGGAESEVLLRFRDVEASEKEFKFWTLYSPKDLSGVNLDDFQLRSGEQYDFAFVQDQDLDGVWAREEYLHGTSDTNPNSDGCAPLLPLADQAPCDEISDFDEIRTGWRVQLKSSPQSYRVYPNPNQGDSDRDGLTDDVELACGLDPRQRDTDFDGLSDYEEIYGVRINGVEESIMVSVNLDDASTSPIRITRYLGAAPAPQLPPFDPYVPLLPVSFFEHALDADCIAAIGIEGYATDPLDADTDGDFINDLDELSLGLHPNDTNDGASFLDDDGDGLPNGFESTPRDIMINGGTIVSVTSLPNKTDSDDDQLPDLLEYYLGSNPNDPDTDGDGILDTNEYRRDGAVCVGDPPAVPANPNDPPTACPNFLNKATRNFNDFVTACNEADVCDVASIQNVVGTPQFGERKLGTNLNHVDTDNDGHFDLDEITPGQRRVSSGISAGAIDSNTTLSGYADITDVFDHNSDNDGLLDGVETYTWASNPANAFTDTDDSVRNDGAEVALGRHPRFNDKLITITPKTFEGVVPASTSFVRLKARILDDQNGNLIPGCDVRSAIPAANTGNAIPDTAFPSNCEGFSFVLREGPSFQYIQVRGSAEQYIPLPPFPVLDETEGAGALLVVRYSNATGADLVVAPYNVGILNSTTSQSQLSVTFGVDLNLD